LDGLPSLAPPCVACIVCILCARGVCRFTSCMCVCPSYLHIMRVCAYRTLTSCVCVCPSYLHIVVRACVYSARLQLAPKFKARRAAPTLALKPPVGATLSPLAGGGGGGGGKVAPSNGSSSSVRGGSDGVGPAREPPRGDSKSPAAVAAVAGDGGASPAAVGHRERRETNPFRTSGVVSTVVRTDGSTEGSGLLEAAGACRARFHYILPPVRFLALLSAYLLHSLCLPMTLSLPTHYTLSAYPLHSLCLPNTLFDFPLHSLCLPITLSLPTHYTLSAYPLHTLCLPITLSLPTHDTLSAYP
jgi:hypothetical protein